MRSSRAVQTPGGTPPAEAESTVSQPDEQAAAPAEANELPRAADIDPTKIRRAVMTRDGWVCPATSPAPPVKE